MSTEIETTTVDQIVKAGRAAFLQHQAERQAEVERLRANRLAREQAVAAGLLTEEAARAQAVDDLMTGPQNGHIVEATAEIVEDVPENINDILAEEDIPAAQALAEIEADDEPEPEPPAPTSGALTRESLLAAAGDVRYLASLTTLGRTSMILSNLLHAASEADAWHQVAACRWLLGRMTVCGLHSSKKSQKAVTAQVAKLADAVLERAKVEEAAEAEALMLASQAEANIARWEQELFGAEPIESWVQSMSAPHDLPADLFPDSLLVQPETLGEQMLLDAVDALLNEPVEEQQALVLYDVGAWLETGALVELTPAEYAEVAKAFQPFPPDDDPDPEPTSPASLPVVYGDEAAFELFCARSDFFRELREAIPAIQQRFEEVMAPCLAAVDVLSEEALEEAEAERWDEVEEHWRARAWHAKRLALAA